MKKKKKNEKSERISSYINIKIKRMKSYFNKVLNENQLNIKTLQLDTS